MLAWWRLEREATNFGAALDGVPAREELVGDRAQAAHDVVRACEGKGGVEHTLSCLTSARCARVCGRSTDLAVEHVRVDALEHRIGVRILVDEVAHELLRGEPTLGRLLDDDRRVRAKCEQVCRPDGLHRLDLGAEHLRLLVVECNVCA